MSVRSIRPLSGLKGEINIPGDKSISHRSIMLGAIAQGTTEITHFLKGADCLSTIRCFRDMGVEIEEKPDVIILDPPRDGIHPKALPKILDYQVEKIVYISCKVTSLARDLEMIQGRGYEVVKCVAVDQFCETVHVETVVLMSRVEGK